MSGAGLSAPGGLLMALSAALLLGVRHATDPDHLTAVATMVLSERGEAGAVARRAGTLGLLWGLGHATTLMLFGLPLVLVGRRLPAVVNGAAELAVGLLIAALAGRLLLRWRRGYFHMHPHRHEDVLHAHPHFHEHAPARGHPAPHAHRHEHRELGARSPAAAFGVGLVHGVGGSAAAGVLVAAVLPDAAARGLSLAVFAAATCLSMGVVSYLFGRLTAGSGARSLEALVPVLGFAGLLFGICYAALAGAALLPPA